MQCSSGFIKLTDWSLFHLTSIMLQVLEQVGGDVDAAVEYLIAEQGAEGSLAAFGETPSSGNGNGNGRSVFCSYSTAER